MVTAIVIPTDPKQPIRQQKLNLHDVDAYRQIVGGPLEVVPLGRPESSLYFHEEGKLERLPVNARATALLWVHNSAFRGRDVIAGPAMVLGPVDHMGYEMSAPADLIDLLFRATRLRVEVRVQGEHAWQRNEAVLPDWYEAYRQAIILARAWTLAEEVRVVPELDGQLRDAWFRAGQENRWIRAATDPPFTLASFTGCFSIEELEEQLTAAAWCVGTAFYYRDLCLIQQVDGGDEWLVIRHGVPFESLTVGPLIETGRFTELVRRFLAASKEQCEGLTY
ncbi:DUF3846 domain-containing protein [Actinokineospora guangxiensis]|uniref:DUF3846 domain-containing protein n=1 Tax=Actinokineospora guangxiensis TaxID=1490288 RepID=A0ABW0ETY8_9PSEU